MNNKINIDCQIESQKIINFIQTTLKNTGKTKTVIGLSGGIDSATSFLLAIKALGKDSVFPLYLPSRTSNPTHLNDIYSLLSSIDFSPDKLTIIPIGSILQKTWRVIANHTPTPLFPKSAVNRKQNNAQLSKTNHLRLANLSARIRMAVIFDQAKQNDALVIGTENYSEHLLGYFTRFGDEASDLEPIRHLYKSEVRQLAKFIGVPPTIIAKPPSADLWVGQTDEFEMGFSYQDADPILYLMDQGKTEAEIISLGYEKTLVENIFNQIAKNNFKKEVPYLV